jgi:hypothetical protein
MDLQNESTFLRISYTIPASILYSQTCVKMCKMTIKDCFHSTMIMTLKCVKWHKKLFQSKMAMTLKYVKLLYKLHSAYNDNDVKMC